MHPIFLLVKLRVLLFNKSLIYINASFKWRLSCILFLIKSRSLLSVLRRRILKRYTVYFLQIFSDLLWAFINCTLPSVLPHLLKLLHLCNISNLCNLSYLCYVSCPYNARYLCNVPYICHVYKLYNVSHQCNVP